MDFDRFIWRLMLNISKIHDTTINNQCQIQENLMPQVFTEITESGDAEATHSIFSLYLKLVANNILLSCLQIVLIVG